MKLEIFLPPLRFWCFFLRALIEIRKVLFNWKLLEVLFPFHVLRIREFFRGETDSRSRKCPLQPSCAGSSGSNSAWNLDSSSSTSTMFRFDPLGINVLELCELDSCPKSGRGGGGAKSGRRGRDEK